MAVLLAAKVELIVFNTYTSYFTHSAHPGMVHTHKHVHTCTHKYNKRKHTYTHAYTCAITHSRTAGTSSMMAHSLTLCQQSLITTPYLRMAFLPHFSIQCHPAERRTCNLQHQLVTQVPTHLPPHSPFRYTHTTTPLQVHIPLQIHPHHYTTHTTTPLHNLHHYTTTGTPTPLGVVV